MYDPAIGQFLSEDPIEYLAGDPNIRRYVFNNPISRVDPTGLFSTDVHSQITSDGLDLSGLKLKKRSILDDIIQANTNTDLPERLSKRGFFNNPGYHAQSKEFPGVLSDQLAMIRHARKGDVAFAIEAIGKGLHILQDFFSHTDWIDGDALIPLYREDGNADLVRAATGHKADGSVIDLDKIASSDWSQVENVIYFTGGTGLRRDPHNRYAADSPGFGRDARRPGSFQIASSRAVVQSSVFFLWVYEHLDEEVRCEIFEDRK